MHSSVTHPRHRRALTALVLTAALVASLATPSFADRKDDLEKQKKDANREQTEAKKHLDASTAELEKAAAALRVAQGKLDAAEANLGRTRGKLATAQAVDDQMQLELERSEAKLRKARAKLKKGQKQLKASESSVEEFAVQQALQGDRRLNAVSGLLRGEDTEQFSEQMSLNTVVGDQQVATMQRLDATRVILKLKREKVQKLRDEVQVKRAQAAANLVDMQRLEEVAEGQAAQVAKLVKARQEIRNSASAAVAEDERQYREKVAEANRLAAQLRALAAKQVKSGGKGSGGDSGGALSYPVAGPITSPFGMRRHPITGVYKLHDGTDFGVGCGTPIRAAASGTVIQQYFNAAYGNRVILNNGVKRGVNVVTTYNHLSRFAVGAGSKVSRGQVIGYVGSTGYSTGCHLHFMVLSNGNTVNPMGWL
ncbi:M23 family metallopeptidase [Aeromicrobium yanjiei]|uniref:Peptidoglycan DD-metalloendopeptidase family protein n=1 Tax=Aeromicrobium yanjiei TaxID=2662028 RepID=A0A5Q2MG43_9ACTN|nr:M23 family metallopeptidase [Aeromicrobium yanjiei]QGG40689.1 peptidoglycan DD-metalloendopeptidase family protein [Aeromicrobium yanjiei]